MDENFVTMFANVRVYEPLRDHGALCLPVRNAVKAGSSYHKATKWTNILNRPKGAHVAKRSKPAASNGLYTLLAEDLFSIMAYNFINRIIVFYERCVICCINPIVEKFP